MLSLGLGDYGSDDEDEVQDTVMEAAAAALPAFDGASTVHISTSVTTLLRGYSDAGPDAGGGNAFVGFPTDASALSSPTERITTAVTTVEYTATATVTATATAHISSPSPAPSGPMASHFHQQFNAAPSPGPSPAPAQQAGMHDNASVDPFSLLPPELMESPGPCPPALQDQFRRYLDKQRSTNKTINDELRKSRAYKNPDLLQKLVEHFKIKECGSAFRPEVFDPDALPTEDYIDNLIKQLDTDQVRKAQERSSRDVAARGGAGGTAGGGRGIEFTKSTSSSLQAVGSATDMYRASQAAQQMAAKIAKSKWDAK